MRHKLWISTGIASLLLGGVFSPIAYASSLDESSSSTVQKNISHSEEERIETNSSTLISSLLQTEEETQSDGSSLASEESPPKGSTTASKLETIAPAKEAIEESTISQGTWGTAAYNFDDSTGTLTVNNGEISSNITGVDKNAVKKIIFGDGVVAPKALSGLFTQFYYLTSISGKLDTSKVTNTSYAFFNLYYLQSLDLSGWNTSNVTNMSYMFYATTGLTSLDLSGWDTSNVTNMSSMFAITDNLTSLDLSGWNTSNVTNISYMFAYATGLTSLDLSGWDMSNVTDMSYMFKYTNLSSITLGSKTTFSQYDVELPEIVSSLYGYSGKWVKTDGSNTYDSSTNFMQQYDGSSPGTYVWQSTAYSLDVKDIQIYKGETWTASDGFLTGSYFLNPASEKNETKVEFSDPLVSFLEDEMVDTNTPGVYHVTYKLGNIEKKATVTVVENQQSITGSDFTMTVGDKTPTAADFKASATDKDGNVIEVTAELSQADLTKAGTYDVVLSTSDGQTKIVTLTVKEKEVDNTITAPSTGSNDNNSGTSIPVVSSTNSTVKTPTRTGTSSNSLPKTGDESSESSIILGIGLTFIALLTLGFVRKRNK